MSKDDILLMNYQELQKAIAANFSKAENTDSVRADIHQQTEAIIIGHLINVQTKSLHKGTQINAEQITHISDALVSFGMACREKGVLEEDAHGFMNKIGDGMFEDNVSFSQALESIESIEPYGRHVNIKAEIAENMTEAPTFTVTKGGWVHSYQNGDIPQKDTTIRAK